LLAAIIMPNAAMRAHHVRRRRTTSDMRKPPRFIERHHPIPPLNAGRLPVIDKA
jgi:hypothetical protein